MEYDIRKWQEDSLKLGKKRYAWIRWFLVFAALMALIIPIIDTISPINSGDWVAKGGMSIILPLVLGTGLSPFGRVWWFDRRAQSIFDEFELAALGRATKRAYLTFMSIVLLGIFWMWLAGIWDLPKPELPSTWSAWGFLLLGYGIALPVLYAEWMVPLPPSDSDGDSVDLT